MLKTEETEGRGGIVMSICTSVQVPSLGCC
jgi:hypothetical protein